MTQYQGEAKQNYFFVCRTSYGTFSICYGKYYVSTETDLFDLTIL